EASMQDSRPTKGKRSRMIAGTRTAPARLDAHETHGGIVDKWVEHSGGVASTSHASHHGIRKSPDLLQALSASFPADHGLKIANNSRKRVGAHDGSDDIVRRLHR